MFWSLLFAVRLILDRQSSEHFSEFGRVTVKAGGVAQTGQPRIDVPEQMQCNSWGFADGAE